MLDTQIGKLAIAAPSDGVVLARAVEPGSYAAPGSPLLEIGDLGDLTITVYVPEDRYGELSLGDTASLSVDSFPGETFGGHDRAHRRPGRVHAAQRADGGRPAIDRLRHPPGGR